MIFWLLLSCGHQIREDGRAKSDGDGEVSIVMDVVDSDTSLLVMAQSDQYVVSKRLYDPDGELVLNWEEWNDNIVHLTGGVILSARDTVLNWPVRASDTPLRAGLWELVVGAYDNEGYPSSGTSIDAQTLRKSDGDLDTGTVSVWILTDDGTDERVIASIEQATQRWAEIWSPYGLSLSIRYSSDDIGTNLPEIYNGSSELEVLREAGNEREMLVLIGETIAGDDAVFGYTGSVPGAGLPAPRAGIVISWLVHAGADGVFDEEDVRLFGETLAHEAGHYLGLFHPHEVDYRSWDALEDTPDCEGSGVCDASLQGNLMYPYPICSVSSCRPQEELTTDQTGVMHRYVGVD